MIYELIYMYGFFFLSALTLFLGTSVGWITNRPLVIYLLTQNTRVFPMPHSQAHRILLQDAAKEKGPSTLCTVL